MERLTEILGWQVNEVSEDGWGVNSISFVNPTNGNKVRFNLTADYDRNVIYETPVELDVNGNEV